MTENRLQEIRQRRAEITPGEWEIHVTEHHTWLFDIKAKPKLAYKDKYIICETVGSEDAAFIASAPADIDFLLAEIERLGSLLLQANTRYEYLAGEYMLLTEPSKQDAMDSES